MSNCTPMTSNLIHNHSQITLTVSLAKSVAAAELLNWDIICGGDEGFDSHAGNIRFQQILSKMRSTFVNMDSKASKKKLVKDVDEFIQSYGGRFLRVDEASGMLRIMTTAEARNKISRSLRENVSSTRTRKAFITIIGELDVMCGRGKQSIWSPQQPAPTYISCNDTLYTY